MDNKLLKENLELAINIGITNTEEISRLLEIIRTQKAEIDILRRQNNEEPERREQ